MEEFQEARTWVQGLRSCVHESCVVTRETGDTEESFVVILVSFLLQ